MSFGFWPGDRVTRFAYYSYTAPEPPGLCEQPLRLEAATWVEQHLPSCPNDDVRAAPDLRASVLDFPQSGFEADGSLAGRDLDTTRTDWCPVPTGGSGG